MFFECIKAIRSKIISLGVIMIALGLILGVSYSTIESPILTVIGYILLFGIFPMGALFSMYGYCIKLCGNPRLLLAKIVVFIAISDMFFYLATLIENKYLSDIYDVIYSFILVGAIQLIVREK